jgi:hypothetical protein
LLVICDGLFKNVVGKNLEYRQVYRCHSDRQRAMTGHMHASGIDSTGVGRARVEWNLGRTGSKRAWDLAKRGYCSYTSIYLTKPHKNNEDRNAYRRQKRAEKKEDVAKEAADKEANRKHQTAYRERRKMEKENPKSAAVAPSSANTVRFQEDDRASEDGCLPVRFTR